jgi:hypothetical protein
MNFNLEEFKSHFLTFDFDNLLNSVHVNSDGYLLYKRDYISKTIEHYESLKVLIDKYNKLVNNYEYNETDNIKSYTYTYIDKNIFNDINDQIKLVYIKQRQLYTSLMSHIEFLKKIHP